MDEQRSAGRELVLMFMENTLNMTKEMMVKFKRKILKWSLLRLSSRTDTEKTVSGRKIRHRLLQILLQVF
ncbi:hypothetical protein AMECASPLE_031117 [Ameca splendens]|uniref:Uncharacterized protein n=1 Tax=Ameca splendens TaxID=208324 RepID=A0ABV0XV74_9TELE